MRSYTFPSNSNIDSENVVVETEKLSESTDYFNKHIYTYAMEI